MSAIEGYCVNLKREWNHVTFARHKTFCFQIPIALLGLAKIWAISHGLAEKLARRELLISIANLTWIPIISPIYSVRHLSFSPFIIPTSQETPFQQSTLHINTKSKLMRTKTQGTITYLIRQALHPNSKPQIQTHQKCGKHTSAPSSSSRCLMTWYIPNNFHTIDNPSLRHRSLETELSESSLVGVSVGITAFCLFTIISSFIVVVWRLKSERAKELNRLSDIEKAEGDGDGGVGVFKDERESFDFEWERLNLKDAGAVIGLGWGENEMIQQYRDDQDIAISSFSIGM